LWQLIQAFVGSHTEAVEVLLLLEAGAVVCKTNQCHGSRYYTSL
jgi:hypothetical protein